jgi:isoleucyl-tRNA synthetase
MHRFADLQEKGLISIGQRPVYFSIDQQRILAESEITPVTELRDSVCLKAAIKNSGIAPYL